MHLWNPARSMARLLTGRAASGHPTAEELAGGLVQASVNAAAQQQFARPTR